MKMRNPQMFQQFQNLLRNQNDPKQIISEMTKGYSKDQMNGFINFANGFGISNDELNKYGIKAK